MSATKNLSSPQALLDWAAIIESALEKHGDASDAELDELQMAHCRIGRDHEEMLQDKYEARTVVSVGALDPDDTTQKWGHAHRPLCVLDGLGMASKTSFAVGVAVLIDGLQSRSELNGTDGKLIEGGTNGRWAVELAKVDEKVLIKPENLKPLTAQYNRRVGIVTKLPTCPELPSARATVTIFAPGVACGLTASAPLAALLEYYEASKVGRAARGEEPHPGDDVSACERLLQPRDVLMKCANIFPCCAKEGCAGIAEYTCGCERACTRPVAPQMPRAPKCPTHAPLAPPTPWSSFAPAPRPAHTLSHVRAARAVPPPSPRAGWPCTAARSARGQTSSARPCTTSRLWTTRRPTRCSRRSGGATPTSRCASAWATASRSSTSTTSSSRPRLWKCG